MTPELLAIIKDVKPASDEQIADWMPTQNIKNSLVAALIARIVVERKEWQDISTAPKDGKFLAYGSYRFTVSGMQKDDGGTWVRASEAAITITALQAERDEARMLLTEYRDHSQPYWQSRAETAEAKLNEFDCCMCGSRMEDHDIGSGHSPVSMYDYHQDQLVKEVERLKAKLKEIAEICEPHTADSNIARLCYDEAMETE